MTSNYSLLEYLQNMKMQSNYKPIVIKILIEKGSQNNYTTSNEVIKNQIELLNFDREDFSRNNVDDSVYRALYPYVLFDGNNVSLDYAFTSDDEMKQCLKICGQKIVQWHIENIVKNEKLGIWRILPGSSESNFKHEKEFRELNSIGVGYGMDNLDLTNLTIDEVKKECDRIFTIKYPQKQQAPPAMKAAVAAITHKITTKDIVVLTRGEKEVIDFGIVTSKYFFNEKSESGWNQRRKVVWLNQGPISKTILPFISKGPASALWQFPDESEEKIIEYLLEENVEYFLLRYNGKDSIPKTQEQWRDVLGEQYHFGQGVANQKAIREAGIGTKTIWYKTKNLPGFYFWGYGSVQEIRTNQDDRDWNLIYSDFKYFEQENDSIEEQEVFLQRSNESIEQQIKDLPGYNQNNSIIKITKKIYQQIIGEDLTPEEELDVVTEHSRTIDILKRKKNIILYGPPGTGKTFTAKEIAKQMNGVTKSVTFHQSYGYEEFIEGIRPQSTGNAITYPVKPGVFKKFCQSLPRMNWRQAAIYVLNEKDTSLHYTEITKISIELEIEPIHHPLPSGVLRKTPWNTQLRAMSEDVRIHNQDSIFKKSLDDDGKEIPGMYNLNKESSNYNNEITELESLKNNYLDVPKILIIDEINRGNISKIFGELITIIENNKRGDEVTLAYSGEPFTVPSNVFIIGTMNTADQSLTHIDAALKRRFSSIEVMPDSSILKKGMKGLPELLDKINEKVREKISRDNQIGHSYFMTEDGKPIIDIKELQFVFATDIIPLLRDYFYDSDDDLKEVLGEQFIDWNEGSDRNVKEDWQNNAEVFRTAIKKAYDVTI